MNKAEQLSLLPELLLPWFSAHRRDLPWRADREPYHIWLSEIMLQQTRVEAVRGYYARFLSVCPDIKHLAEASPDVLNKLWEGLGYYSRVRNLQAAAKEIMSTYQGNFPTTYEEIRRLKGIGDYTAGAICSICFEQPTPAVDGNVLRVIMRLTGDSRPIGEEKTKAAVREALRPVYPKGHCGDFTQALMELGATVCAPNGAPACADCPLNSLCKAKGGDWKQLPVKAEKRPRRVEKKTVFVLECDGRLAVCRRKSTGLLAGLWELPNVDGSLSAEAALRQAEVWGVHPADILRTAERIHLFTHIEWQMTGIFLRCRTQVPEFVWADREQLYTSVALPTAFRIFLEESSDFKEKKIEIQTGI